MMEIQQLITSIVRVTQENDLLIKELEGEVAQVQIQVTSIDTDLANLHQFCKIGKQCAKQCYFPPELFGGIKTVSSITLGSRFFYRFQGITLCMNMFRTVLNIITQTTGNWKEIHQNGLECHNLVST